MIDLNMTVHGLYSSLCVQYRKMAMDLEAGNVRCAHCQSKRSGHLSDYRCSIDSLSRHFLPVDQKEREDVSAALTLIEELKAIAKG